MILQNENIAAEGKQFIFTGPEEIVVESTTFAPPAPDQILVKTVCSMISIGTEMICFEGKVEKGSHWDNWLKYPFNPGYLAAGKVVQVGAEVEGFEEGDLIVAGKSHAAFFHADPETVFKVPEGIEAEEAIWFQLNVIVQYGIREINPQWGESAVVVGLGLLGQFAIRLLKDMGMSHVIGIDPAEDRCEYARSVPGVTVLQKTVDQALDEVLSLTGGEGADNVFDITGHPAVFEATHQLLRPRGKLGLIGDAPAPKQQNLTGEILRRSITVTGSHARNLPFRGNPFFKWGKVEMVEFFFHLLKTRRLELKDLISHRYQPEEGPAVYKDILKDRSSYMAVLFDWE